MAKRSPFIPSAVLRARSSLPPLVAISHPEVENSVVNLNPSAVLLMLSFTCSVSSKASRNAFSCSTLRTLRQMRFSMYRRRPDSIPWFWDLSRSLRSRFHRVSMASVGRWSLCVLLVACLGGCTRNPEVRKKNYLDRGNSYFQKGKYQEAIVEYLNAIQIDPKFADAHFALAKVFLQQHDWNHAYQELSRAAEDDPANWKAQITLGNLMLAAGRKLEARGSAETVLKGDPDNVEAEELLANSDAALGLLPKAISEAQAAVRMDPKRSASYSFLAELQERNKDISSAEENYEKATSEDPKS